MGRKTKNTVEYFSHPVHSGKRMSHIRGKFGNDGYAVWYMLLEEMGKSNNHFLTLGDYLELSHFVKEFKVSEEKLISIVDELVKIKTFDNQLWNEFKVIYCSQFMENMDFVYDRRKRNVLTRNELYNICVDINDVSVSGNEINAYINDIYVDISTQSKVKETKRKETKLKENTTDENDSKWYDWFMDSWNINYLNYKDKTISMKRLTKSNEDSLKYIVKTFGKEETKQAMVGLMMQKSFPGDSDLVSLTHFLKDDGVFIDKYLMAHQTGNKEIYKAIKKFE